MPRLYYERELICDEDGWFIGFGNQRDSWVRGGKEYVRTEYGSPKDIRTPEQFPYSYSMFYLEKSPDYDKYRDSKKTSWEYSDRMTQWDRAKYDKAWDAALDKKTDHSGHHSIRYWSAEQHEAMVRTYFGKAFRWVATAEGCNHSSGYPYFVFMVYDGRRKKK